MTVEFGWILFGGITALAIFVVILSAFAERKRRQRLEATAAELGFTYQAGKDRHLARQFAVFRNLNQGSDRYVQHVFTGQHSGFSVTAGEFHYETHSTNAKGNRSSRSHYVSIFVLHLGRNFPTLLITPEGVFSKIAQAIGYDDIDFESHEFSRAFVVRCPDKRFAYDFCNPAMIEFLLDHRRLTLELHDDMLATSRPGKLDPARIVFEFDVLAAVRSRLPASLFAA